MRRIPAALLRGGTSKGLFFHARDLPPHGTERDALLLAAVGSPDPYGMQLNGVGGGISSTSKVAIVSSSTRPGIDVDYLFAQVSIKDRHVDWSGSCGNIASGVGLFAAFEGLLKSEPEDVAREVRVWQVNQEYEMVLQLAPGLFEQECTGLEQVPGVGGKEPPIYVELNEPHDGKLLLPSGNVIDSLPLPGGGTAEATLVTPGNPTIFVHASVAGLNGAELPGQMDFPALLPLIDHLRTVAAPLMGIEVSDALRVAFLTGRTTYTTSSGEQVDASRTHLLSRISAPGRIHHAHTGTGAIALSCAAQIEGSVPWKCLDRPPCAGAALNIGHPGGVMPVRSTVTHTGGLWHASQAGFLRTARYLMRGEVFVPSSRRAP